MEKAKLLPCAGNGRAFNYNGGRYSEMFSTWHLNNVWNLLLEDVIQAKNLAKCRAGVIHLTMDGSFKSFFYTAGHKNNF